MKSIYEQALAAGLNIASHASDLYIQKTKESTKLIFLPENKDQIKNLSLFIGTDQKQWYELPFSYDPFWNKPFLRESK